MNYKSEQPSMTKLSPTVNASNESNRYGNNPPGQSTPAARLAAFATVNLFYVEQSPIRVRGPITGYNYHFSGAEPKQLVDSRDAAEMLRTKFFRKTL